MSIVRINRSQPLNPDELFGGGVRIAEEDSNSISLVEIDLRTVALIRIIQDGESVNYKERLRRLKLHSLIRLDAAILALLLDNPNLIPETWKREPRHRILFEGTVFDSGGEERLVCHIFWSYQRKWKLSWQPLEQIADPGDLSAVLPLAAEPSLTLIS